MSESEFIQSIQCSFPYRDRKRAIELTRMACSISPNAAFSVADEISRPPAGDKVDPAIACTVLSHIESGLSHPLTPLILSLASRLVEGQPVSVSEAILALRQIETFPGQYAALSIAYFASDDIAGLADAEYNRIRAAWGAA